MGPRASIAAAAWCFGGGLTIGGMGILMHSQLLLNLGYGVLAGTGVGLSYTPPIQTLMQWFPDRKGLAMGTLVAGFGSGALVFVPSMTWLMGQFSSAPTYLGTMEALQTTTRDGVLYAQTASHEWVEAVQATAADLAQLPAPYNELTEGLYAVGTGSTGAGEALMLSGAAYFALMSACAFAIRTPAVGWKPAGYDGVEEKNTPSLTVDQVMRTPQFYLLGTTFACLTTGTYGLFSVAKGMTSEVFSSALPLIVTASFTSSYLMLLSVANLSGRFGIATLSDRIGCRSAFNLIIAGSLPIYLTAPILVHQVAETGSTTPLYLFVGSTFVAVFLSCGVISTCPAYEAALFGTRNVGAVHGRMLLFNSLAAVAGPNLFIQLRSGSEASAIHALLLQVDANEFSSRFGMAPVDELTGATPEAVQALVDAKTLTISKLLSIGAPPPSSASSAADLVLADPTPYIYDSTMYTMAGLVCLAGVSHNMIRPVDPAAFPFEPDDEAGGGVVEVEPVEKQPQQGAEPLDASAKEQGGAGAGAGAGAR
eukprot:g1672.t1